MISIRPPCAVSMWKARQAVEHMLKERRRTHEPLKEKIHGPICQLATEAAQTRRCFTENCPFIFVPGLKM
ncbi:hypothetical protein DPMN_133277 [Dreissena polymorpha]|uniref:Uncharacterized protein n=1 Tax=Dreissena polymorpha TaxID=45954 RepID=A0A9D4FTY8_DREPO|nr:hypothetical protein DPMN_133277 [Dreissena polymorpha]